MSQIVDVPGQGEIEFPDEMSDADITAAIRKITTPQPGRGEAFVRGAGQGGSFGLADELAGIRQANVALPPAVRGAVRALPFGLGPVLGGTEAEDVLAQKAGISGSWMERYRKARDLERTRNAAAKEAHGGTFLAGEVGGGLVTLPFAGGAAAAQGAKALSLAGKMARGLKAGAGAGAAYGAGASEAETPGGVFADAALSAALGGPLGAALPVAGAAIQRVATPVARWLGRRSIEQGRKALSGIGAPLSARKEIPEQAVRQALDTGAVAPLGTVSGAAARLKTQAEQLGEVYGQIVDDLASSGVTGPNAELLARAALDKATAAGKVMARAEKGEWEQLANDLRQAIDPTPFASKKLGLQQAQEIKRNLQDIASSEYSKLEHKQTPKGKALEKSAAFIREAMEESIAEQAEKAPEAAARFMPVKERLSNVLAARAAAREGAAKAARRAPPSLLPPVLVGGVTGSPGLGLLTLASRLADRRVASTLARGARGGEKLLGAISRANPSQAQQLEAERLAALIAALRGPNAAPVLAAAGEEGP